MECKILGCTSPVKTKKSGICVKHYYRFRRNGSYEPIKDIFDSPIGTCLQCSIRLDNAKRYTKRFCSSRCYSRYHANIDENEIRYCEVCSASIKRSEFYQKKSCSPECARLSLIAWNFNKRASDQITPADVYTIFQEQGGRCLNPFCLHSKEKVGVDHIIPLSLGGLNVVSNLQLLCFPCNNNKKTKTIDYRSTND